MYSKLGNGTAWLIILLSFSTFFNIALAQTTIQKQSPSVTSKVLFSAKPASCVALHQGRKCYAVVALSWQTLKTGDYCIVEKENGQLLQCWKNSRSGSMSIEFESSTQVEYQLTAADQKQTIAQTSVNVSWVHKSSPRKRRWRLF